MDNGRGRETEIVFLTPLRLISLLVSVFSHLLSLLGIEELIYS